MHSFQTPSPRIFLSFPSVQGFPFAKPRLEISDRLIKKANMQIWHLVGLPKDSTLNKARAPPEQ